MPLLAQREQQIGEVALRQRVHQIGSRTTTALHAHVERPIKTEREAALGLIELERGDTEVEDHAIKRRHAPGLKQRKHVTEATFDQMQPTREPRCNGGAAGDRVWIAVNRIKGAARRTKDRRCIPAATEGAVAILSIITRAERCQHFIE